MPFTKYNSYSGLPAENLREKGMEICVGVLNVFSNKFAGYEKAIQPNTFHTSFHSLNN